MYTRLCSSIVFPLHEALKGHHSVSLRRELEQSQWLGSEALCKLQVWRLRAFMADVGRNVPYYSEVFSRAGLKPEQISSISDLQALPFLDKPAIRGNLDRLKSVSAGNLTRFTTGGSSGEPLVFYIGPDRISHDIAAKWRATRWWNVDIGDPEVVLWGSPIEVGRQDRLRSIRDKFLRTHLLPAFRMSERQLDAYLQRVMRLRPRIVSGYASAITLLARHADIRGVDMKSLGIKLVIATGETVYPDQVDLIGRVLNAPVANLYGSRDAGFIAHGCPQGGLHIAAEHVIVELVDAAGNPVQPGERGEIVTTHLATRDFPFIRYRTGDIAQASTEPCSCGRGLPVLREVLGRATDFIRTHDGNVMHALALIYEVRDKLGVQSFKFIQRADLSVELLLVGDERVTADVEAAIRRGVLARLGHGAVFTIQRVDDIPPERSGKHRYVVSEAGSTGGSVNVY